MTLAPGGTSKTTLVVLEAPFGHRAELRQRDGSIVASSPPSYRPKPEGEDPPATVALLTQSNEVAQGLRRSFGRKPVDVTVVGSPADVPDDAVQLSGLHMIVIAEFDTGSLRESQVRSLQDYVALGGSLVVVGGATGARNAGSLPEVLLPLRPTGTISASLAPLAELGFLSSGAMATVVTGELRGGRSVLQAPAGVPLVVQAEVGAGRVVQLAYDPSSDPFASDPALQDLAWDSGLARSVSGFGLQVIHRQVYRLGSVNSPPSANSLGVSVGSAPLGRHVFGQQLWRPMIERRPWLPWPLPALGVLGAYVLLLFPITHLVLRRGRRSGLIWVVAPLAALAFASGSAIAGAARGGGERTKVEVHTTAGGGTALIRSYEGSTPMSRDNRPRALPSNAAASTLFTAAGLVPPAIRPNFDLTLPPIPPGAAGGGVITYRGTSTQVSLRLPGALENIHHLSIAHQPSLESKLRVVGSRVIGTVTNRSPHSVHRPRAQLPEGALARLGDSIRPGETLQVDSGLRWPEVSDAGLLPRADPQELMLYAATAGAFTRSGQIAVAGLGGADPEESLIVEVAPLQASDTPAALTDGARFVSAVEVSQTETLNVYELGGVPGLGRVSLAYEGVDSLEVHDWQTGTWRPLPPHPTATPTSTTNTAVNAANTNEPLAATEVDEGLVRIRTRRVMKSDQDLDRSTYQLISA